jgi:tetratricopeptide (TPR) repeat protein
MKRLGLLLAAVAVVLSANFAVAFDEILVSKMPVQKGSIVKMTPVEVTLDVQRREKKFPVNTIVSINFDLEPLDLKTARRYVSGGQYDMALQKLEAINLPDISREPILADIAFYKAYANAKLALGGGDKTQKNDAIREMVGFTSKHKEDNYHYFEAIEMLGDLAVGIGDFDRAIEQYVVVGRAPWPSHKLRAKVLEGRAYESQEKWAEALERYELVLRVDSGIEGAEEQKLFAILGKAACLAATGKHEEGIKIVEEVVARGDPSDSALFANAYNTMGKCYQLSNKPKDALLAFLHTDILFYTAPEAHAEALSHLIDLWTQMDRPERALQARTVLKQRYPGSIWNK